MFKKGRREISKNRIIDKVNTRSIVRTTLILKFNISFF